MQDWAGLFSSPVQLISFSPHADPIVRLLEGAVPGPATQGSLPADHGGPTDPATGGQGPHAHPAQQLLGQPGGPPSRWRPGYRFLSPTSSPGLGRKVGLTLSPTLDPSLLLPGLRGCAFRSPLPPRISGPGGPTALATGTVEDTQLKDSHRSEIDISDLGSRNYGARTDFYCLVTEDDI